MIAFLSLSARLRGEGAERAQASEVGEGQVDCSQKPLIRLAASLLATFSPLRGEKERAAL
jgi:hypothetical protein